MQGVRVLEFSQVIAAPFAGQFLAELGAYVVKVEPPEGESWRLQMMFAPKESATYQALNRGKDCITLRLTSEEAQSIVHRLVKDVDVVLINYRPDVPAKFRIDYDTLRAIKPDLIYGDLTAFGRRGPWAMRPGYDGVVQAMTGLMAGEAKLREDGSPSTPSSTAIADFCAGMALADAVLTALFHRARTGEGQLVECSLLATALNLQGVAIMEHEGADADRNRIRNLRRRRREEGARFDDLVRVREQYVRSPAEIYRRIWLASDGAVAIGAETPAEVAAFRNLFETSLPVRGEKGFALEDARFLAAGRDEAVRIASTIANDTSAHWIERCHDAGLPAAPVQFPQELADHPHVEANGWMIDLVHEITGPQRTVATPLAFSGTPLDPSRPSPPLGRDTAKILREIGYSDDNIAELEAQGGVIT